MRIAIVAMGASSRAYVNQCSAAGKRKFDEVWVINVLGSILKHDLLFHMDDCRLQERRAEKNEMVAGMMEWLKDEKFFTSKVYPEYPGAMKYPLEEVANAVGGLYFNSTCAYALGYAIYKRVDHISLYGMDFSYPDLHKAESGRACIEYLIGKANGKGIPVEVPKISTLMDANQNQLLYGYDAYNVSKEVVDGKLKLSFEDKDLPSVEEIENRYDRGERK